MAKQLQRIRQRWNQNYPKTLDHWNHNSKVFVYLYFHLFSHSIPIGLSIIVLLRWKWTFESLICATLIPFGKTSILNRLSSIVICRLHNYLELRRSKESSIWLNLFHLNRFDCCFNVIIIIAGYRAYFLSFFWIKSTLSKNIMCYHYVRGTVRVVVIVVVVVVGHKA